jgi:fumarate reductase flavoprotein subunit
MNIQNIKQGDVSFKMKKLLISSALISSILLSACSAESTEDTSAAEQNATEQTSATLFTEGTYTGSAAGLADQIDLDVTFSEEDITGIEVAYHNESDGIGDIAIDKLIDNTMEEQSLDTDIISGATVTSMGVKRAIEDAVEQAGGEEAVSELKAREVVVEAEDAEYTYDVVVAGGGMAGLMSALKAAEAGADVALIEKVGLLGGTSVTASGNMVGASEEGFQESMHEAWHKRSAIQEENPVEEDMLEAVINASPGVFETFDNIGVEFNVTVEEDGSQTFRGKPTEGSIKNAEAIDIPSKDANTKGGSQIVKGLVDAIKDAGVEIYYNTPATALITDDSGTIIGVESESDYGHKIFNASSVILATGDYALNEELTAEINEYGAGELSATQVGNTGDGLLMALEAGAVLHHFQEPMSGVFNANPNDKMMVGDPTNGYPFEALLLNLDGERVFAEDGGSHPQKYHFRSPDRLNSAWVVMDEEMAQNFTHLEEYLEATENDHPLIRVYKEDSIEDLAQHMDDVEVETLVENVARYNEMVAQGEDTDFGKDPKWLDAIDEGPYYVAYLYDNNRGNYGGIRTNPQAQVVDENEEGIPGLYAAGTISSGQFFGDYYPGRQAIGIATHMGYVAGQSAAENAGFEIDTE